MSRLFDKFFGSTVDYPWLIIPLLLALTGFSVLGRIAPETVTDLFKVPDVEQKETEPATSESPQKSSTKAAAKSAPAENPRQLPDVKAVDLSDSDVTLVIESDHFFSEQGARALRALVQALEDQPSVESVFWMERVPVLNIFGLREPLLPPDHASPRQFEVALEKALKHPLVKGQLLSEDGRTMLMLIKLDWLFVESDEDCTDHIKEVAAQAVADYPDVEMKFLVTGRVPIYLTFVKSQLENRMTYQLVGYGMVCVMAVVLFRGLRAVLIVSLAPALGVFWTIGFLNFFNLQDNPFNDIVLPVLLSLIGLTDGVHLMVEIRRLRATGLEPRPAARAGICNVGLACALTSLTTAIGLGSLALAHHDIVQEFGWSCVLGVLLTFIAVITTIPLACSTWLGKNIHLGHEHGVIDRHLNQIGLVIDFVLKRPRAISMVAIASTVILIGISLTLRPDERRSNALPTGSEASRAIAHMDAALGGLEQSSIEIRWSSQVEDQSPEIMEVIAQADDLLNSQELIGHPISIRNFIDALPGTGAAWERMSMMELLPPPLKRAFYTPEKRQAMINFRVQDLGIARYGPVFEEIERGMAEITHQHPEFSLQLKGSAASRWRDLYQIVLDLTLSLGSASLIIFLVLTIAYRSLRLGLISLVPNFFPLALTGTYLVWTGQALELASVCAFTVCLGLAVDDTIHFLTRFGEERGEGSTRDAIHRAFTRTGTALIMTTIVLVVGFSTVLISDMRDQRIFAIMGAITLSSALFADLVFLPALLAWGLGDQKKQPPVNSDQPPSVSQSTAAEQTPEQVASSS